MKKIFKIIGICALTCFSFYYTKEAVELSKSKDPIMQKIVEYSKENNVKPVNALIDDDCITPGVNGKKVDINKSYEKMKRLGEYNENMLVFISDYPSISIKDNYDKFIIKGKDAMNISLVFKIDSTTNIDKILSILDKNNVKATFFIDGNFLENNIDFLKKISNFNQDIASSGYNENYKNSGKIKSIIKSVTGTDIMYCYSSDNDKNILKYCSNNNMYTIKPTIISDTHPFLDFKKSLSNGGIFSLSTNDYTTNELEVIINFIKQKGYNIVSLEEIIEE